jgi:uncharacterized membrane protein YphA (DoxX/SURF4 family)
MDVFLWSSQILLALSFLYSGFCKSFLRKGKVLALGQTGVRDISLGLMRLIGVLELFGVAGILLPWSTGILPVLTPVTALCFAVVMVLAARVHHRIKEPYNVRNNILLLVLALIVACFRFAQL